MAQPPKIAIPTPHSQKPDYAQRSLPQYLRAIEAAGGEPLVVQLGWSAHEIAQAIRNCQAALLPGSAADVDPQKYGEQRQPQTATADALRDAADELILQDAFNLRKPILGICYGLQSLNVWRSGTLVQDIAAQLHSPVKHAAGGKVDLAHPVSIERGTRLDEILSSAPRSSPSHARSMEVNSSHHQAAAVVGDGLRISARCPEDKVVEAIEGIDADHFVLAVQWHPERGYEQDAASQAIFKAFIRAAQSQ